MVMLDARAFSVNFRGWWDVAISGVSTTGAGFRVADTRNVDGFFGNLVTAGLARFTDFSARRPDGDPLIDLAGCCDLHELLIVQAVNRDRAERAAQAKQRGQRGQRRR